MSVALHSRLVGDLLMSVAPRRGGQAGRLAVEVGVLGGRTSFYLLDRFPDLILYMVDPWERREAYNATLTPGDPARDWPPTTWDKVYREVWAKAATYAERGRVWRMDSYKALFSLPRDGIDLVFLDGDPSHGIADCEAYWARLRPGGVLCGKYPLGTAAAWAGPYGLPWTYHDRTGVWSIRKVE